MRSKFILSTLNLRQLLQTNFTSSRSDDVTKTSHNYKIHRELESTSGTFVLFMALSLDPTATETCGMSNGLEHQKLAINDDTTELVRHAIAQLLPAIVN